MDEKNVDIEIFEKKKQSKQKQNKTTIVLKNILKIVKNLYNKII